MDQKYRSIRQLQLWVDMVAQTDLACVMRKLSDIEIFIYRSLKNLCLLFLLVTYIVPAADAKNLPDFVKAEFDHKQLHKFEKEYIQTALLLHGLYHGSLSGNWDDESQKALDTFAYSLDKQATNWLHIIALIENTNTLIKQNKWKVLNFKNHHLSILFPSHHYAVTSEIRTMRKWVSYKPLNSALALIISGKKQTEKMHLNLTKQYEDLSQKPLITNNKNLKSTLVTTKNNMSNYMYSVRRGSRWHTVQIVWDEKDIHIIAPMIASISSKRRPRLKLTDKGQIAVLYERLGNYFQNAHNSKGTNKAHKEVKKPSNVMTLKGTGTGFFINENGYIVTNAHVINKCKKLVVRDQEVELIARSDKIDIAVLKSQKSFKTDSYASFSRKPATLNSDVTVAGYPYASILGGLNITRGSVSAKRGLGNSPTEMQITAPIQPGNSGGPVVNKYGYVVGVSVATLNALEVAKKSNSIPQNVNFAVKGEVVKTFLNEQKVNYHVKSRLSEPNPEELAKELDKISLLIKCY